MKEVTLIKTSGEESTYHMNKLSIREMARIAGCEVFDSVNLRDGRVMMVDDTGFMEGKKINPKATELYHGVCRPGTTHPICGDVVICWDKDWE